MLQYDGELKLPMTNVAATVMNLHGFEAPNDYEPTLIEVVDN
jgi:2,3-bisphosphoglycerate-independent phosphoglycerate mutase